MQPRPLLRLVFGALERGEFRLHPAVPRTVYADKARTVHQFSWTDEFVLAHLARLLTERAEPLLPDCVFSFRKGRGHHAALRRVCEFVASASGPLHVARRDVRSFGESLVHEHILADLELFAPGETIRALVRQACAFPMRVDGVVTNNTRGLPTGANVQLVFENLYLRNLDLDLQQLGGVYVRFGDDVLFVTRDAAEAARAARIMERHVRARGVEFAAHKSIDASIVPSHHAAMRERRPGHACAFEYLGMRIDRRGELTLPTRKMRVVRSLIRERLTTVATFATRPDDKVRLMSAALRELAKREGLVVGNPMANYLGAVTDDAQLAELDRWVALLVLSVAFGRGKRKGTFARLSFRALRREYGLVSLRHQWRCNAL